jgi:hypothetical protein
MKRKRNARKSQNKSEFAPYSQLLGVEVNGLTVAEQIESIGLLVDVSGDLRQIEGIKRAIDLCTTLVAGNLSREQKGLLHYFCANAWNHQRRILQIPASDWEQPALEQEILQLRLALSLSEGMSQIRRYQILTNLGNVLSDTWRCVDAIQSYNAAIALDSHLGMAVANRASTLRFYADLLWTTHDRLVLTQTAFRDLRRALRLPLEGDTKANIKQAIRSLEADVNSTVLRGTHDLEKGDLGRSKAEQHYRRWCLKHGLFLNATNDLGPFSAAASDPLLLPGVETPVEGGPKFIGFFNAMKQEFVAGRWNLFFGLFAEKVHFADKRVRLANTLDYPAYSLSSEQLKTAFRVAYSLFDKVSYFINDYLALGIPQNKVTFRTIWTDAKTKQLRPEFVVFQASPVKALFWLSRDLYEDGAGLTQALEPEARDLALIRNHLEHKYLKLHDDLWRGSPGESVRRIGLDDSLAFSIRRSDFERRTIRLYQLVRSALIYLACTVNYHELHFRKTPKNARTLPIILEEFDDRWKRSD